MIGYGAKCKQTEISIVTKFTPASKFTISFQKDVAAIAWSYDCMLIIVFEIIMFCITLGEQPRAGLVGATTPALFGMEGD